MNRLFCFWMAKPGKRDRKTIRPGAIADGKKGQIIGVVKDFDFNSLNNPMEPMVMDVNPPRFTEFAINIGRSCAGNDRTH